MLILFSLIIYLVFIFIFAKVASKFKLIDIPDQRKLHDGKIPLIGGLAIFSSILVVINFYEISHLLQIIIITSSILVFLGAIDDSVELGVKFRLVAQLITCLVVIGFGIEISSLGYINNIGELKLNYFTIIFTLFCIMGLINSFNFIDGIDGLSSAQSLISIFSIIFLIILNNENYTVDDIYFILNICFIIFLFFIFNFFNFYKIFLGDAGSMFLGYFIACLLILFSQNNYKFIDPFLTIWCVTLPVFDIISVVIRRLIKRANPFIPDREHVHHILIKLGFSNKNTLLILMIVSLFLNIFGFFTFNYFGNLLSLLFFLLLCLIYAFIMKTLSDKANKTN